MDLPEKSKMVTVAQLVRAPGCDSGGRGFEPRRSPQNNPIQLDLWKEAISLEERTQLIREACGDSYDQNVLETYAWLLERSKESIAVSVEGECE